MRPTQFLFLGLFPLACHRLLFSFAHFLSHWIARCRAVDVTGITKNRKSFLCFYSCKHRNYSVFFFFSTQKGGQVSELCNWTTLQERMKIGMLVKVSEQRWISEAFQIAMVVLHTCSPLGPQMHTLTHTQVMQNILSASWFYTNKSAALVGMFQGTLRCRNC